MSGLLVERMGGLLNGSLPDGTRLFSEHRQRVACSFHKRRWSHLGDVFPVDPAPKMEKMCVCMHDDELLS